MPKGVVFSVVFLLGIIVHVTALHVCPNRVIITPGL